MAKWPRLRLDSHPRHWSRTGLLPPPETLRVRVPTLRSKRTPIPFRGSWAVPRRPRPQQCCRLTRASATVGRSPGGVEVIPQPDRRHRQRRRVRPRLPKTVLHQQHLYLPVRRPVGIFHRSFKAVGPHDEPSTGRSFALSAMSPCRAVVIEPPPMICPPNPFCTPVTLLRIETRDGRIRL